MNTGTSAIVWASIMQEANKKEKSVKVEGVNNSSVSTSTSVSKKDVVSNV